MNLSVGARHVPPSSTVQYMYQGGTRRGAATGGGSACARSPEQPPYDVPTSSAHTQFRQFLFVMPVAISQAQEMLVSNDWSHASDAACHMRHLDTALTGTLYTRSPATSSLKFCEMMMTQSSLSKALKFRARWDKVVL